MALIVQKFGGSSVADAERIQNVANIVADTYREGNDVIVVVSAQGDTTDDLIAKAEEINPRHSRREMDQLLAAGEQISISLLAMALEKLRIPVISLLGWQAGFNTSSGYTMARIKKITTDRLNSELDKNKVIIVAGFQGINKYGDVTTLGRGGSDTSAVALAAALHADKCQIFTDVEGVYTADPRKIPNARKLKEITYDEMLELATLGAQVLNNRSVEMAKKYNVELEVLSSLNPVPGTMVKEVAIMEKMLIRGVTKDADVARVSVLKLDDKPGIAFKLFDRLAAKKINVDIILQSNGRDGTKDITFTVNEANAELAKECIKDAFPNVADEDIIVDTNIAKVSVVGAGMETHPGTASRMFDALYSAGINIEMISTSEIKISVLVEKDQADRAVSAVHKEFFPED
ncbi:MAG: aspartate kinase [Clostridia bacterium]|nr:aspartate kinase [Clostridia bacterium]